MLKFTSNLFSKTNNINNLYFNLTKNFASKTSFEVERRKKRFYKNVGIIEIDNIAFDSNISNNSDITSIKNDNLNLASIQKFINISQLKDKYYHVTLDNRKSKSFFMDELKIPNKQLALALAEEWSEQKEFIEFYYMHLVRNIVNVINVIRCI